MESIDIFKNQGDKTFTQLSKIFGEYNYEKQISITTDYSYLLINEPYQAILYKFNSSSEEFEKLLSIPENETISSASFSPDKEKIFISTSSFTKIYEGFATGNLTVIITLDGSSCVKMSED